MSPEEIGQTTSDILLEAIARVLELNGNGDLIPTSAVVIYSNIKPDGSMSSDYVITTDLDMYQVAGMTAVVHASAVKWFTDQDG